MTSPIEAILANCIDNSRFDELYALLTTHEDQSARKPLWDGNYVSRLMWVRRRLVKYNGQLFLSYLALRPEHPLYRFSLENKPRLLAKRDAEDVLRDYLTSLPESILPSIKLIDFLLAMGANPTSALKEALRDHPVRGHNRKLYSNYPFLNKAIRKRFLDLGADPSLAEDLAVQKDITL